MIDRTALIALAASTLSDHGLTQEAAAARLGTDRTLINHALKGRSIKTCIRIIEEIGGFSVHPGYKVMPK